MRIGEVVLEAGALLAPMAGVTDAPFRLLCHEQGAVLTTTEMLSAKGYLCAPKDNRAQRDLLMTLPGSGLTALQLFGSVPEEMAEAARRLVAAQAFCMLDLNMGCPAPKITGGGAGCALMREPVLAGRIVAAVVRAVRVPVTVKMRAGWDDTCRNAVDFARMAEDNGASAVTVHGRTRAQQYAGEADWTVVAQVKAALRIPVVGNGDVSNASQAAQRMAQTGCDAVMLGRAAMGNPWVFADIRAAAQGRAEPPPTAAQRLATAARHLEMMVRWKGETAAIPEMRKHIAWYLHGLPGAARLRHRVNSTLTQADMLACLAQALTGAQEH